MSPAAQTVSTDENTNYTAVDPQKQPLEFIIQNKEALDKMPDAKKMKFIDMAFRRYALPKYQAVNKQMPLDSEEIARMRLQFAARMLDIKFDQTTELKDPKKDPSLPEKLVAGVEGAGAGVLGGIRTIADLGVAINKHLGPIGEPGKYIYGAISRKVGEQEGKAYEEAKAISPAIASTSAAVGHQIPTAIASGVAGSAIPSIGKAAPLAAKVAQKGIQGAAAGAGWGAASVPREGEQKDYRKDIGEQARNFAIFDMAFPVIGRLMGYRGGTSVAGGAAKAVEGTAAVAPKAVEAGAKPTLEGLKAEIATQRAAKAAERAARKAAIAAKKAGTAGEQATTRATKAAEATQTAQAQAQQRAAGGGPTVQSATAAQAVAENPQIKISAKPDLSTHEKEASETVKKMVERRIQEGKIPEGGERRGRPHKYTEADIQKIVENLEPQGTKDLRAQNEQIRQRIAEREGKVEVQKVPEGVGGKKVRAKEGQPASPAQQTADRERMAQRRAEGKAPIANREITGGGIANEIMKHLDEVKSRYAAPNISVQHIPEIEDAVKELEGGEMILKEMQKYRRLKQINDDEYVGELTDWLRKQLGEK